MRRRTLVKTAALAVVSHALPRFARAYASGLDRDDRVRIAALGEVVLPATLGAERRARAVDAFLTWLDEYQAGGPMSYGYGVLRYAVVPQSPALHYPRQISRLQELSRAKGSDFTALSPADGKAVVQAALIEAQVTQLPDRPDGQHIASDLLSHYYTSSEGNDFLFKASIRVSECRGLDTSGDRPVSIT